VSAAKWISQDKAILPDRRKWGRGYGGENFTPEELDETAATIAATRASGLALEEYGPRMTANNDFQIVNGTIFLPSGFDAKVPEQDRGLRWNQQGDHQATCTPDDKSFWLMPERTQALFREQGHPLDQHGRPCNPHGVQLVSDLRIGLSTGLGAASHYGEAVTVDVVITDGRKVLLTSSYDGSKNAPSMIRGGCQAGDFGIKSQQWSDGRRDINHQGVLKAARRIAALNLASTLPEDTKCMIAWGYRPTGVLETWHAWTVTYAVRIRIPDGSSEHVSPGLGTLRHPPATWHSLDSARLAANSFQPDGRLAFAATLQHKR